MIYKQNTVTADALKSFYLETDLLFTPRLSEQVNLVEYVNKVYSNAVLFEVWHENCLVGLIACYANDVVNKKAFITSVIVRPEYHGRGIAKQLLKNCIGYLLEHDFTEVSLEVFQNNMVAQRLYHNVGFVPVLNSGNKIKMTKSF